MENAKWHDAGQCAAALEHTLNRMTEILEEVDPEAHSAYLDRVFELAEDDEPLQPPPTGEAKPTGEVGTEPPSRKKAVQA